MDCVYPDLTTALGDRAIHKNTENIKADAIAWLEVTRRGAHNCFRIIEHNVYLHNIRCSIESELNVNIYIFIFPILRRNAHEFHALFSQRAPIV